jgi:DNA invertase Pin-like site-specific DNA recombinase
MGRFFLTVMAGAAELERNLIAERTREAMGYKKSQDERISGHIPFGKTLAADELHLVDNPAEQTIIAAAKTYYAAGLSLRAVAARLAAESYRSRTGKAFTAQAIKNMVEEVA